MTKIKTLIIDDESLARQLLKTYLQDIEGIELIGECKNGFEGVKEINEQQPDLVFLDIQMPKITGLEMLDLLDHKPLIIFTTAYDEYAIKAFELHAVDYLLKPFAKERLHEAIVRAKERIGKQEPLPSYTPLQKERPDSEQIDRIVVRTGRSITIIPKAEIYYIEAQDDYVQIHSQQGKHLKQWTMKYLEEHLDPREFVRVHRSAILRVACIDKLEPYDKDTYVAILENKVEVKVSTTGYKKLREVLGL